MPRKTYDAKTTPAPQLPPASKVDRLAEELRTPREFGQPSIDERHFDSGLKRVVVIWDEWDGLIDEDRTATILNAYKLAEGPEFTKQIVLAMGYTVPDAVAAGLLPYKIITAWRRGDGVTLEQLRRAMIEQGASILHDVGQPELRSATISDAEACIRRLIERLPDSEQVWQIVQEVGATHTMSWNAES